MTPTIPRPPIRRTIFLFIATLLLSSTGFSQTGEQVKQQAETELQQMTPDQVEARIRELGMTRAEAEARARQYGIDLNSYLRQRGEQQMPLKPPAPEKEAEQPVKKPAEVEDFYSPSPQDLEAEAQRKRLDSVLVAESKGMSGLPYFGYDLFRSRPAAFEPSAVGPVDPEYLIGAADVLRISVWGQVEFQNELVVDKEGKIFIPTIGQVVVSGLTLEKAYDKLLKQMSRSYSGLVSQPPTVWLDVTLARLRPKRIYIMGEVAQPGGYTVSSYATVFNALYGVGGPTIRGSLRDVRVVRGNKVITRVDLYDYLTGAEQTNDIRVQTNDIIFVPPRGKTVSIAKEVRRPAVYELLPGEHLRKLLEHAGGPLSTAYLERIQIDRIVPFQERRPGGEERRIIDVDFREIMRTNRDFELADGDSVSLFSILDQRLNIVTISGAVIRPGIFELQKTPTLRALILAAEGLEPKAYTGLSHLIRTNPDQITRRIISFDLTRVLENGEYDLTLERRDEVIVYSTEATEVKDKYVTIRGEVKQPGKYPFRTNLTLRDLILLAGGYTEEAEVLRAEVSRITPGGLRGDSLALLLHPPVPTEFLIVDPGKPLVDPGEHPQPRPGLFYLQHRDEVMIRPDPNYRVQQNVTIAGDFTYPGVYSIRRRGEQVSEILARAGGPTKTSYLGGAQFFRKGRRLLLNFTKAYYEKNDQHDVVVLSDDSIYVPSRPYTVFVTGEVNKPGLLSYIPGRSVSDYIDRAGGLTDSSSYALLTAPTGETRRINFGLFSGNPEVAEGSTITVLKIAPPPASGEKFDLSATIKDTFAILTSAATIAFIVWQVSK